MTVMWCSQSYPPNQYRGTPQPAALMQQPYAPAPRSSTTAPGGKAPLRGGWRSPILLEPRELVVLAGTHLLLQTRAKS